MKKRLEELNEQIKVLRKVNLDNEEKLLKLLQIPEDREFYGIFIDNEKIKSTLKNFNEQYILENMEHCHHAFVITEMEKIWESGRTVKTPIYCCVKCELTNKYDVCDMNDLVDNIKSQMAYIFADTAKNGIVLSKEIISLQDAIEIYKHIITTNPNITDEELKLQFSSIVSSKKSNSEEPSYNSNKKEKQFDPSLWKPIGYKPVDVKPVYSQKHTGFVEYQAPEDRYEVRGVMPPAKNWYQQDLDEIAKKLTLNKK